jgi:hypothetical protein
LKFLSRPPPPPSDRRRPPQRRSYDDVAREAAACGAPLDVDVAWMSTVASSVHATPVIADLHSDARKEVVVPAFVHELESLEAPNGAKGASGAGWPAYHASTLHGSPVLVDVDGDGTRELAAATYDGEVLYFRESGERMPGWFSAVPRLRVRRDWFAGLAEDPVDHLHPDVKGALAAAQAALDARAAQDKGALLLLGGGSAGRLRHAAAVAALTSAPGAAAAANASAHGAGSVGGRRRRRLMQAADGQQQQQQPEQQQQQQQPGPTHAAGGAAAAAKAKAAAADAPPPLSEEADASFGELFDYGFRPAPHAQPQGEPGEPPFQHSSGDDPQQLEPAQGGAAPPPQQHHRHSRADPPRVDAFGDPLPDAAFAGDDAPWLDDPPLDAWGDERGYEHRARQHAILEEAGRGGAAAAAGRGGDHVWVDAHVLATPAIGDVDGDGHPEVVVPVSYFFDPAQYEGWRAREVQGLDLSKYVAGEFFCVCSVFWRRGALICPPPHPPDTHTPTGGARQ